jgi:hypothetical protein
MSLWPSRGLELHGFEIKSYRGDWLNEVKNPAKAEEIARFCHRWWVVADKETVEESELPPSWGLLIPKGRGLFTIRQAELQKAEPMTYAFIASVFRNISGGMVPVTTIEEKLQEKYKLGKEEGERSALRMREMYRALLAQIADFEKASGVKIGRYESGEKIGAAVALAKKLGEDGLVGQLKGNRNRIANVLRVIDEAIEEMANG